jgi:hypothetical protein
MTGVQQIQRTSGLGVAVVSLCLVQFVDVLGVMLVVTSLPAILIDLVEEYSRHVGHADLIRESADGLTGEDPPG